MTTLHWVLRAVLATLALDAFLSLATHAQEQGDAIPHIDECGLCQRCIVDAPQVSASSGRTLLQHGLNDASSFSQRSSSSSGQPVTGGRSCSGSSSISSSGSGSSDSSGSSGVAGGLSRQTRAARSLKADKVNPYEDPSQPESMRASAYRHDANDKVPKSSLPNCTVCRGCNTELSFMAATSVLFDRTFTNEKGATSGWLFRATTNRTASGSAVVKVYCMPLPKRPGAKVPTCAPEAILKNMRLLLAIEKIVEECGFEDIVPKTWVDKVDAPVPGLGFHIRWHGLWMEVAEGVSMENFLHKGEPSRFPPSAILDLMHNRLNKTQVIRAAIFDLLTSQCDRHAQNIFINEQGQIKLIDNEAALQSSWKNCGFNSILVPTTQKQEIVRLSNEFVNKLVTAAEAPRMADPQLLLDYRCYLPGGSEKLGTEYPPKISQCLKAISEKSVEEVQKHYGFLEDLPAFNLKARATDMITKGFEWTYKYGKPLNADSKRYRVQPKCCSVKYSGNKYVCAHPWEPKFELPIGDPITGRAWTKARPDTGTYQGGTFPEDAGQAGAPATR